MGIAAPFDRYRGEVRTEWIDLNGHMNLAYYTVLFDYATDLLFDTIGIGRDYKRDTNHGTFVAESHNLYEHELLVDERVRIASQIIGADSKRLHLAHEMFRATRGAACGNTRTDVSIGRSWPAQSRAVSRRSADAS